MFSIRTLCSLSQFFGLFDWGDVIIWFEKYGLRMNQQGTVELATKKCLLEQHESRGLVTLLDEIIRTHRTIRKKVSPVYQFDERYDDLSLCLLLDGYRVESDKLYPLDPSILEAPPIEDDLTLALSTSGLDADRGINLLLSDSAAAFRRSPPDHNACMNNARVALESLAREIASQRSTVDSHANDPTSWGSNLSFLRAKQFLSEEEEKGLAGVYRFLCPGSHRPLGLTESESCRLGRSLAMSMCWYLLKRHSEHS